MVRFINTTCSITGPTLREAVQGINTSSEGGRKPLGEEIDSARDRDYGDQNNPYLSEKHPYILSAAAAPNTIITLARSTKRYSKVDLGQPRPTSMLREMWPDIAVIPFITYTNDSRLFSAW
jgi:hypothetical protein